LPLIWAFYAKKHVVRLIGHSKDQIAASITNDFIEIDYHKHLAYFTEIDRIIDTNKHNLIPGPHDLCYRVYVEYLVSRGYANREAADFAEKIHNKRLFRNALKSIADSYNPWFIDSKDIEHAANNLDFKILFKPDHAGGGRGIVKFDNNEELQKFVQSDSYSSEGIFEEVIDGNLFSITIFMQSGKLTSFYCEREFSDSKQFRVNASVASNEIIDFINDLRIPEILSQILATLGFLNGFCHSQIIIRADGSWKIVESMLRLPGDMYSFNAERFGSFPYSDLYISTFTENMSNLKFTKILPRFPDNSVYGRVIHRRNEVINPCINSYCSFISHNKKINESYSISYFRDSYENFDFNSAENRIILNV
jgi:hypothetical protein